MDIRERIEPDPAVMGGRPCIRGTRVDVAPSALADYLVRVLRQFEGELIEGAIVSVDRERARAPVLPIRRS
jgi:predicted nuclease of predicted toxin-antitoxin system